MPSFPGLVNGERVNLGPLKAATLATVLEATEMTGMAS